MPKKVNEFRCQRQNSTPHKWHWLITPVGRATEPKSEPYPEPGLGPARKMEADQSQRQVRDQGRSCSRSWTYCVGHKPKVSFVAVNFQLLLCQPPSRSEPQLKAWGINLISSNRCAWRHLMSTLFLHAHVATNCLDRTVNTSASRSLVHRSIVPAASWLNYNFAMHAKTPDYMYRKPTIYVLTHLIARVLTSRHHH